MRRLTAVLLLMLILTSCAKKEVIPVTTGFSCQVTVQYDDAVYRGALDVHDDASVSLTIREPQTVAGLCIAFAEEQLTITFGGMELVLSQGEIPASAAARLLGKALATAAKQAAVSPSCTVEGDAEGVPFTLQFDKESGLPTELTAPSCDLFVAFEDWKEL